MKFRAALTAFLLTATSGVAFADTTVRMLHIETNPEVLKIWNEAKTDFEAANPGVKVEFQGMETNAFKARLTTLLQADSKPDIIYSWGGGLVDSRIKAGVLQDVTADVDPKFLSTLIPAGVKSYTRDGKIYGLPYLTTEIGFLVNKELLAKAGVTIDSLSTWPGFIEGVKKLRAASITPIAIGGQDKWQFGSLYGSLALKIGGEKGLKTAMNGEGGGFTADTFVKAGEKLKELAELKPFQSGYLSAKAQTSGSLFSDGKAAMLLYGTWFFRLNPTLAADKVGLPLEKMEFIGVPNVPGGAATDKEAVGQLNGWLFTKGASKESVKFMETFLSQKYQEQLASGGFIIPVSVAAQAKITHPIQARVAKAINDLSFLQLNYDVQLGPNAGATSNDIAVGIAAGQYTPADAAKILEDARKTDASSQ
ncbi:extracellular solute-binding protein [Agrobacterium sp. rho-13.3]|jgi:raffinose/stachyose/melibiose transport system substrate-binding protein|uniref:extracellular solute-binding protein n=1 Tax=Agrobacterium sp. rho-13.3 TaxID=3072980 RepID=UPI002A0B6FF5|nr:extracellular solute-binding protein [Agrobacterium sp. rho-13.3]MDX8308189.1 extracellular solute-binding protein [Agrobacterium sp. rho-13.3]